MCGLQRLDRGRIGAHDRGNHRDGGLPFERLAASHDLVEHTAKRKDVGAVIARVAIELLGGHVLDRSAEPTRHRCRWGRVATIDGAIVAVSEASSVFGRFAVVRAASPKSSSFTSGPDAPARRTSITLPGFRSRCAMPARCARSSASPI